jgi:hypothetical protein
MDLSVGPDGVMYAATHSRGIWGYALPAAATAAGRGDPVVRTKAPRDEVARPPPARPRLPRAGAASRAAPLHARPRSTHVR